MPRAHHHSTERHDPPLPAAASAFARGAQPQYAPDLPLEPLHTELHLSVDIAGRAAKGRVRYTVVARKSGARSLRLDAVELDILQVLDPSGEGLTVSTEARGLRITWDRPFTRGEQRVVEISWQVTDPITGMSFSPAGGPAWMATDHETERARHWLPCVDHPAVRTTLDLFIRGEAGHVILANGALQGETLHEDGTRTAHWALRGAGCPSYLLCIAMGELVTAELGQHEGIPLAAFAPAPYTADTLRRCFGPTGDMMRWLTTRLGSAFPFPKYYQFSVPQIGGAMENISLVSWDDVFLLDERGHAEFGWVFDLINLHEMAHSWFGDAVVVQDFAHVWLKESWATYMESVWLEETVGPDAGQLQLYAEKVEYRSEADGRYHRPIVTRRYDSSWDMFDRHLYPGGAFRLHMLRQHIGDEAFWSGTQDFLRTFHGRTAETADFRRILEAHSGQYLGRFFEQWFESPGYPALKVSPLYEAERRSLVVHVEQTQENAAKGIGRFSCRVELAVQDADGAWTEHAVTLDGASAVLVIPGLAQAPQQIVVDPHMRLLCTLRFDPGLPALERALACPFVSGRLHAAETLIQNGRPRAIAAVLAAWRAEPRWRLRHHYATLMGAGSSGAVVEALLAMLAEEADPRAMMAVTDAAGKLRDPRIGEALAAWAQRPERPYRAMGAALRSLGQQRDPRWISLLVHYADDRSLWGHVARGALQGLGALRSADAAEALLSRSQVGLPQVRVMAMEALGEVGSALCKATQDRIGERLCDALRDPSYNVRMAAARGLSTLGRAQDASAVRALLPRIAAQDHPRVERIARRLAAGVEDGLRREVEQLTDKLRAAEARLATLEARVTA